ncbi:hypothetical protein F7725_016410 [Dissostichus mawsoni]|uniref:PiggyBac transposable element-derived protein 4 C-terminal zinc-ribbon domain-containing protein n=2 Tax=Dissostichus mawsoni TaxID=36200 RepID=A0A7J5Z4F8_DISMA|nr:hypothetical protein F7725_016410 [Dissostichus mawsoni]
MDTINVVNLKPYFGVQPSYHFMDIAVVNRFLLYKELYKRRGDPARAKPLTQKSFREQLAKEMVEFSGVPAAAPPRPPTPPPSLTCMPAYYGEDATTVRRYCRKCSDAGNRRVKTPVYCRKCQVPLCFTPKKNCYREWHDLLE